MSRAPDFILLPIRHHRLVLCSIFGVPVHRQQGKSLYDSHFLCEKKFTPQKWKTIIFSIRRSAIVRSKKSFRYNNGVHISSYHRIALNGKFNADVIVQTAIRYFLHCICYTGRVFAAERFFYFFHLRQI